MFVVYQGVITSYYQGFISRNDLPRAQDTGLAAPHAILRQHSATKGLARTVWTHWGNGGLADTFYVWIHPPQLQAICRDFWTTPL